MKPIMKFSNCKYSELWNNHESGADSEGLRVQLNLHPSDLRLCFHGKFWINLEYIAILTPNIHNPYS